MENNQQELIFKLSMFEQQIQQLQQQLQAVEQGIIEINSLSLGLDDIKDKEGKEVMAMIGKGIFARTKLLSEELIVDIGGRNLVKKSIPETKKLIDGQIKKLEDIKKELRANMERISRELTKTITEAQKQEGKN